MIAESDIVQDFLSTIEEDAVSLILYLYFLPPAYVIRRKGNIFTGGRRGVLQDLWFQVPSLVSFQRWKLLSLGGGGGTPVQSLVLPEEGKYPNQNRGTPSPGQDMRKGVTPPPQSKERGTSPCTGYQQLLEIREIR